MLDELLKVFISYSHKDDELCQELIKHLNSLKRQKVIEDWYDRRITAGMEWAREIDDNLNKADIILLLISSDFINSDYCFSIELDCALEQHKRGESIIIPIILRSCDWKFLPFAKFQTFPKDARAVLDWPNTDLAFTDVMAGISEVSQSLHEQRKQKLQQEKTNQDKYKEKVKEALSLDGKISIADQDTLDELREDLGITKKEAQEIQDHAYKPFKDSAEKVEKYRKTLLKYIKNGNYPFSDEIKKQLEIRQRDLGIKTEDIEQIIQPILVQAQAEYHDKLQAKGVEEQPQLDLETETQKHITQGIGHFNKQDYDSAIADYNQALKLDPYCTIAYYRRGLAYFNKKDYDKSIADYTEALKLYPNYTVAYYRRGWVYKNEGSLDLAVKDFKKVIELNNNKDLIRAAEEELQQLNLV